jgi:hypothetical protein
MNSFRFRKILAAVAGLTAAILVVALLIPPAVTQAAGPSSAGGGRTGGSVSGGRTGGDGRVQGDSGTRTYRAGPGNENARPRPGDNRGFDDPRFDDRRPVPPRERERNRRFPRDNRPFNPYIPYYQYYPYLADEIYSMPRVYDGAGTATYQIVEPPLPQWVKGHFEEVPMQDVIDGEFVDVFHPAVYRRLEDGSLEQIEEAHTTREPKVRLILTKIWIEGRQELPEPEDADDAPAQDGP